MQPQKLKFGLIANPEKLLAWQAECIRSLRESGLAELKLIAVPQDTPPDCAGTKRSLSNSNSIPNLTARVRGKRASRAERIVDFTSEMKGAEILPLRLVFEGKAAPFALPGDVAEVCKYRLDFILLFQPPAIRGEILQSAEFGVWTFRHGMDNERDTPPGFWELFDRRPVVVAALERLADCPGKTIPLYRGFFPATPWSLRLTSDLVLRGSIEWLAKICRDVLNGCADYLDGEPVTVDSHGRPRPSAWQWLLLYRSVYSSFLREQVRTLIMRERWHVGIVRAPIHSFLNGRDQAVEWLPEPGLARCFADPFAVKTGNQLAILFEDFDQIARKGRVSAVHSADAGGSFTKPLGIASSVPWDSIHTSYPYIFQHEGEIYCLPETHEANEVRLYRAVEFPWRWERIGTILEGVPAVDPTLFQHEGKWWLFYALGGTESNIKLYLAFASDLLGPWHEHPGNPVKTDVRGARPGGTPFMHEGVLYRPAQDSTYTYGGAMVIQRVDKLSATRYEETFVCRIVPTLHGRYSHGFHTLAAAGDLCVVDGKKFVAIPQVLPTMLKEKIKASLRRIVPS